MASAELIEKMSRVLEGLIDCRVEFLPASALSTEQWDAADLALLRGNLSDQPTLIESSVDTGIGFPVNVRGTLAGLAVIRGWKQKEKRPLIELAELLTAVLATNLAQNFNSDERLGRSEKGGNVIEIRPARSNRILELKAEIEEIEAKAIEAPMVSPLTTLPLLIEVADGFPLQRVAVEIHQQSERWAMLSITDLPADVLNSREELKALGAITLFIPNITELTMAQQLKLADYLAVKPAGDMPHVVAGLVRNDHQTPRIVPQLMDLFCCVKLDFNDKDQKQTAKELVEATLQMLVQKARESVLASRTRYVPFNLSLLDPDQTRIH